MMIRQLCGANDKVVFTDDCILVTLQEGGQKISNIKGINLGIKF